MAPGMWDEFTDSINLMFGDQLSALIAIATLSLSIVLILKVASWASDISHKRTTTVYHEHMHEREEDDENDD